MNDNNGCEDRDQKILAAVPAAYVTVWFFGIVLAVIVGAFSRPIFGSIVFLVIFFGSFFLVGRLNDRRNQGQTQEMSQENQGKEG